MSAAVSQAVSIFRRSLVGSILLTAALSVFVVTLIGPLAAPARAASTETTVSSTLNPSSFGQSVTFKALVAGFGGGAPSGTVTFKDGTTTLGSGAVDTLGVGYSIAVGENHTCALTSAGGVKCWGHNAAGHLGDGTTIDRSTPINVSGLTSGVSAIAAGWYHTCALTTAGGVKCWGYNGFGQLGDGTGTQRSTPVNVSGLTSGVSAIAAGAYHTCALTTAGGVKCWGYNNDGQLGDGTATVRTTPADVSGLTSGVGAIAAGENHACALTSGGGVKCWGNNSNGQLGDGTVTSRLAPVDVYGLTGTVSAIAAGWYHTCALTSAGGGQCWGYNGSGQLGDGTTIDRVTPVDVSGLNSGVSAIAAGAIHSCALTGTGGAKCWGNSTSGQLGDGTTRTQRLTPVDVSGLTSGVSAIAAGFYQTCALTSVGGVKCWGSNGLGQLGDSTTTGRTTPVEVGGFGAGVALVYSKASYSTFALAAGSHTITANYGGDATHGGSTSAALTQLINPATAIDKATSVTAVQSSQSLGIVGQSLTFTATVSSSAGTPTGTVIFMNGSATLGAGALSFGTATFATSALPIGSHTITAVYGGDASFAGSTSSGVAQTVNKGATTTSLSSSPNPSTFGQPVMLTATVAVTAPGSGTPTGSVTFKNGSTTLGTTSLSSGAATFMLATSTAVGTLTLAAIYNGDGSFSGSTSSVVIQTINKGETTISGSASPNPNKPGQSVNLKATVTAIAPTLALPIGTVTFKAGSKALGSGALANGQVTVPATGMTIGTHTITANYAGSADLAASTANVRVTVDPKMGPEFLVNTVTAHAQQFPAVTYLNNGDFIVTWASNAQDGSGYGIYAQRYNAFGTRLATEFKVNTITSGHQTTPAIASLQDGGFVIVWLSADGLGLGIYAQRYNANSTRNGAELKITRTAKSQSQPSVAGLKAGGFVVAWNSNDGSGRGVYARRYDSAGAPSNTEFKVNTTTVDHQSAPSVAPLTGGGFAVAWQSRAQDGSTLGIYAQRYDATAKARGKEFKVNTTTAADQWQPSIAGLKDGGFIVTWQSMGQDGSGLGVYMQRFAINGTRTGSELPVNTVVAGDQSQPCVAAFPDGGGFMVMWTSAGQNGSGQGIYAQAHKADGQKSDIEFRANTTAKNQFQPALAAFTGGNFVAVWTSRDQDGSLHDVYGQRFSMPNVATASKAVDHEQIDLR